jgi:hypothetical protein
MPICRPARASSSRSSARNRRPWRAACSDKLLSPERPTRSGTTGAGRPAIPPTPLDPLAASNLPGHVASGDRRREGSETLASPHAHQAQGPRQTAKMLEDVPRKSRGRIAPSSTAGVACIQTGDDKFLNPGGPDRGGLGTCSISPPGALGAPASAPRLRPRARRCRARASPRSASASSAPGVATRVEEWASGLGFGRPGHAQLTGIAPLRSNRRESTVRLAGRLRGTGRR